MNKLFIAASIILLSGCNCTNFTATADNGDDTRENPYLSYEDTTCEPMFGSEVDYD